MINLQNFYKDTLKRDFTTTGIGKFYLTLAKPTVVPGIVVISPNNASLREIIKYTATGTDSIGDYVEVTDVAHRGLGGTTAQTHKATEPVRMNITQQHFESIFVSPTISDPTFTGEVTVPEPTEPDHAVSKQFAEGLANAGASDASATGKGINRLSTDPGTSLGTATMTIASPVVITKAGHGLTVNDMVKFTTDGALPTGITAGTNYYVIATDLTTDTFKISATQGGTAITTTGSQSGTHTLSKTTPTAISDTDPRLPINSFGSSSTGNDTYTLNVVNFTAYKDGQEFTFKADVANTGTASLNVSTVGAKTLNLSGAVLTDSIIRAGSIVKVRYNLATDAMDVIEISDDTSSVALPNRVVRAGADGLIDEAWLPSSQQVTLTAGEALTAGQAVQLSPYAQLLGKILYDNKVATSVTNQTNSSFSFTVGVNSNRVLLVGVTSLNGAGTTTAVTYAGVSMVKVDEQINDSSCLTVWKLVAPATGTNTVQITGNTIYGYGAISFYNVDQTTYVEASAKGAISASPTNINITPLTSGAMLVGFAGGNGLSGSDSGTSISFGGFTASNLVKNGTGTGLLMIGNSDTVNVPTSITGAYSVAFTGGGSYFYAGIQVALKPANAMSTGLVKTTASNSINGTFTNFIGFVNATVSAGASVVVTIGNIANTLTGLVLNSTYYLSDTAGAISTSAGTNSKKVGLAISSTQILIKHDN